jgi:septal ring factor EnvC (AmiA/AmiB activator)
MSKEPENLILTLLRELRAETGVVREDVRDLKDQMSQMRKDMQDWQETIATAGGFAMHSHLRGQKLEAELAALRKRVEKLEKAK